MGVSARLTVERAQVLDLIKINFPQVSLLMSYFGARRIESPKRGQNAQVPEASVVVKEN